MNQKTDSVQSWSAYWRQGTNQVSCLPGAPRALGNLLDGIWADLARSLDEGSSIIDLACGGGAVGSAMLSAPANLEITGVDFADFADDRLLPFPILQASIEKIPLADASFDAAVSQFGIEYADAARAGAELQRLLKPGSKSVMVVHHAESVIVRENIKRRELLRAVNQDKIWAAAIGHDIKQLQTSFEGIHAKFGESALFLELANAIRSVLGKEAGQRAIDIEALRTSMLGELNIIDSLTSAAISPDAIDQWTMALGEKLKFEDHKVIRMGDDIASWLLTAEKLS